MEIEGTGASTRSIRRPQFLWLRNRLRSLKEGGAPRAASCSGDRHSYHLRYLLSQLMLRPRPCKRLHTRSHCRWETSCTLPIIPAIPARMTRAACSSNGCPTRRRRVGERAAGTAVRWLLPMTGGIRAAKPLVRSASPSAKSAACGASCSLREVLCLVASCSPFLYFREYRHDTGSGGTLASPLSSLWRSNEKASRQHALLACRQ